MELIRCTRKLQKEMGLASKSLFTADPSPGGLGPWHANLIYIERKKCIVFVNDATRFNFIIPDVSRALIRGLDDLFRYYLTAVLVDQDLPGYVRESILEEYSKIEYAGTTSKSVLGTLNDLAFHYKYHIQVRGGVHGEAVPEIIRQLNQMPMSTIDWAYPIEALKARCGVSG